MHAVVNDLRMKYQDPDDPNVSHVPKQELARKLIEHRMYGTLILKVRDSFEEHGVGVTIDEYVVHFKDQ